MSYPQIRRIPVRRAEFSLFLFLVELGILIVRSFAFLKDMPSSTAQHPEHPTSLSHPPLIPTSLGTAPTHLPTPPLLLDFPAYNARRLPPSCSAEGTHKSRTRSPCETSLMAVRALRYPIHTSCVRIIRCYLVMHLLDWVWIWIWARCLYYHHRTRSLLR